MHPTGQLAGSSLRRTDQPIRPAQEGGHGGEAGRAGPPGGPEGAGEKQSWDGEDALGWGGRWAQGSGPTTVAKLWGRGCQGNTALLKLSGGRQCRDKTTGRGAKENRGGFRLRMNQRKGEEGTDVRT